MVIAGALQARVRSGRVGVNKFRVVSAKTASATVTVSITK